MGTKGLSSIAEEYFYTINPLAQRIGEDVAATKDAYEGLWSTLSLSEQNQAIDETIITPEVALKYAAKKIDSKELPKSYPKLCIQTGMKFMVDETGSTLRWRDEHSAPFSFMTQSQMNLSLSDSAEEMKSYSYGNYIMGSPHYSSPMKNSNDNEVLLSGDYNNLSSNKLCFYKSDNYSDTIYSTNECSNLLNSLTDSDNSENIFSKIMNKTSLLQIQSNYDDEDDDDNVDDDDLESLVPMRNAQKTSISDKSQMNISLTNARKQSSDTTESTALLDTPSSYNSYQSSHLNQDDSIPKTGFEFLDNW
ncbi:uncharacterized protein C1orf198 homolog [Leptopilina heterotoma]|uniref:uncharacterized protein C1orf198 homolog n=1 Tax=Leptopilina heterotoma TaxID=63436 RepID=UPI001CA9417B|nr:uncharacterized protein C1orf198 homolog [Leptopilina heterotoma]XP_043482390.1 uncharacterized protein C1orf198 homolog [Leptopilina heterotoma]